MEPTSPSSEQAFLEELRRHRAELRESMSALEDAMACAGHRRSGALGPTCTRLSGGALWRLS